MVLYINLLKEVKRDYWHLTFESIRQITPYLYPLFMKFIEGYLMKYYSLFGMQCRIQLYF